jgi:hypothetical protein
VVKFTYTTSLLALHPFPRPHERYSTTTTRRASPLRSLPNPNQPSVAKTSGFLHSYIYRYTARAFSGRDSWRSRVRDNLDGSAVAAGNRAIFSAHRMRATPSISPYKLLLLSRRGDRLPCLSPMLRYSDSDCTVSKTRDMAGGVECFGGEPFGWLVFARS